MAEANQNGYDASVAVSPLQYGGETKGQDRARWSGPLQVAAVCDGVTSSPHSERAAELLTLLSAMLFGGDTTERMLAASESLIALRLEALHRPVSIPARYPGCMHDLLRRVAGQRLADAYQTTLVALHVAAVDDGVQASIIRCGDSAFFAFSPDGALLATSPSVSKNNGKAPAKKRGLRLAPGDTVLVRVLGDAKKLSDRLNLDAAQLQHPERWLVCLPLDRWSERPAGRSRATSLPVYWLTKRNLLLVPHYLPERIGEPKGSPFARVRYSSTIRPFEFPRAPTPETIDFSGNGAVTDVVPDHIRSGRWEHVQERFPAGTHFVLATDGFYGSFEDPAEMWTWLSANRHALNDPDERDVLVKERHRRLQEKSGDDDLSFVWVFPCADNQDETSTPVTSGAADRKEHHAG